MKKKPFTHLGGTSGRVRPRGASGPTGPKLNLRQAPAQVSTPANAGTGGAISQSALDDALRIRRREKNARTK